MENPHLQIRPGAMRHVLVIQQRTTTLDAHGGASVSWSTLATVRGAIRPLGGSEQMNAEQPKASRTSMVTTWYRSDVSPLMRITTGGRTLEIVSVQDPNGEKRLIELTCREIATTT